MRQAHESEQEALRELGEAIREAREEQGLGVDELAEAAGITPEDVHAIEAGHPDIAADLFRPIPAEEDQNNSDALRALGETIRRIREEQGFDVEQLAASTRLRPDDIRALEAGRLDVSFYALRLISAAAGDSTSWTLSLAEKLERYRHEARSHDRDGE